MKTFLRAFLVLTVVAILLAASGPNQRYTSNEVVNATSGVAATFTVSSTKICECATIENLSTTAGEYFTIAANGGTAFRVYAGKGYTLGCDGSMFVNKVTYTAGSGTPAIQIVAWEYAR